MKALVLTDSKQLKIKNVPNPEIGPEEVLIRVKACGICGSDVHGYDGSYGRRIPPVIMGHEASGEIVEAGLNVTEWYVGDRVTFDSTISCGHCKYCRKGQANLCNNRRVIGVSCDEYHRNGAFAEFISVPQRILYKLPENMSYEKAAMIEPVSIAFHAVGLTKFELNDTVVVVGAGMIGLLTIQTLQLVGCGKIIAVDIDERKLSLAKSMGADFTINNLDEEKYFQSLAELVGQDGADVAIEAVGLPQTVKLAVNNLRKGGALTLVGNIAQHVEIPLQDIVTRQIKLQGSCASNGEYPACLDMIDQGRIDVESIISATAPLEEGADWFKRLYENKQNDILKVLLIP